MKKILGLLFLSSSLFSMQMAYKLQSPHNRFNRFSSAVKKNHQAKIAATVSKAKHVLANAIDTQKVHIEASSIRAPHSLADVKLYYGKKGFVALQDNKKYVIEKAFMDKTARNITKKELKSFFKIGYFALNQTNDGTFTLKAHYRLTGGGILGATIGAFLGKAAVSVVGHGAIQLVALCTGPAYFPTVVALESCFGHAIEVASLKGAIAGGIALGTATGPV